MNVGGCAGSVIGGLAGLVAGDRQWVGFAIAEGAVIGGMLGAILKVLCHTAGRLFAPPSEPADASGALLERLRRHHQEQAGRDWRGMLDGQRRLRGEFTVSTLVAPPRCFEGTLRQRSDLIAALEASASNGGGPRMLILGGPGLGKSVALVVVADHLAVKCQERFGIPLRLSLGSWNERDDDLVQWVVRELCAAAGPLPAADGVVRQWMTDGEIAPMLDGLDEIPNSENRRRCVAAINSFIDKAPRKVAVVVTSRSAEYASLATRGADMLGVNAAIELQPLRPELVAARLRAACSGKGGRLAYIVERNPCHPVAELLQVPLWLWVAGRLDQSDVDALVAASDRDQAQRLLTDAYLRRPIEDLASELSLRVAICRHLLAAIAGFLVHRRSYDSITFRFENLTPARPTLAQRRAVGVAMGVGIGPASLPLATLLVSRIVDPVAKAAVIALIIVTTYALVAGLIYGWFGIDADARPVRSRLKRPVLHRMRRSLIRALAAAMMLAVLLALTLGLGYGTRGLALGLSVGLVSGLAFASCIWLMLVPALQMFGSRMTASDVVEDGSLDEGLHASRRSVRLHGWTYASLLALFCGSPLVLDVGTALMQWLPGGRTGDSALLTLSLLQDAAAVVGGLIFGYHFGIVISANKGGWYLLLQHRLRRRAERAGLLPPNPECFLSSAIETGILRRTGSGVQFRHRLFRDRLAEEAPEPGLMDLRLVLGDDGPLATPAGGTDLSPRFRAEEPIM